MEPAQRVVAQIIRHMIRLGPAPRPARQMSHDMLPLKLTPWNVQYSDFHETSRKAIPNYTEKKWTQIRLYGTRARGNQQVSRP